MSIYEVQTMLNIRKRSIDVDYHDILIHLVLLSVTIYSLVDRHWCLASIDAGKRTIQEFLV
jgi:hypothetical protein